MDGAAVIPVCYHKCGDNWVLVSPGSLGKSPGHSLSLRRLVSVSWPGDSHSPVSCTVTSTDHSHALALPRSWELQQRRGERRQSVSCQELVSPADPCTALYCVLQSPTLHYSQA